MANLTVSNGLAYGSGAVSVNQANTVVLTVSDVYAADNVSIATSDTALGLGAISSPVFLQIKNTDPTNYVLLSLDTHTTYPIKISPLSSITLELTGISASAIYVKAHTSACVIAYTAC